MSEHKKPHQASIEKLIQERKKHVAHSVPSEITDRLKSGNIQALSEALTLIESEREESYQYGQEILNACLNNGAKSIRIGITGVPGVGKSTFIESFGMHLINIGLKVAVLAIDPSSERSGGSILGDKTRMQHLSAAKNAFIRPSPTGGSLGGVARKTRESIMLCEAAGYDVILVETVGVGQSEIAVHSMTDFFLLLMLAGAGDELQGIKRGIMEMADSIVITKADGDNINKASMAQAQYKSALHLFPPSSSGWIPKVQCVSALQEEGIKDVWEIIESFRNHMISCGEFEENRRHQQIYWMKENLKEIILDDFYDNPELEEFQKKVEEELANGKISSFQASRKIFEFRKAKK